MPPVILALDIATRVGWACGPVPAGSGATPIEAAVRASPQPASGVYRIGRPGIGDGAFYADYRNWLEVLLDDRCPSMLVFEAPILLGRRTAVQTARRLMGLAAITELVAEDSGVPRVLEAHNQAIKRHATGNGRAKKPAMMAAAKTMGWTFADDNEADALWLWDYAGAQWRAGKALARVAA